MAKRLGSRYLPGRRSRDWLKIKGHGRQEFVIAGYTRGQGRRQGTLGALVLGMYEGEEARALSETSAPASTTARSTALLAKLKPLERDTPPFPDVPKMPRVRKGDVVWVEPKLVAEVEFVEWTHDGRLRAPSYKGLREDKAATEVRREEPSRWRPRSARASACSSSRTSTSPSGPRRGSRRAICSRTTARGAGARSPSQEPAVHDEALPRRLAGQVLLPEGRAEGDAGLDSDRSRSSSRRATSRGSAGGSSAPLVNDELALLWMVNMGCIDLNTWYSRIDKPDRPDWVLFDLDPSPDVGFAETVQVALLVKQVLDTLGLESFVKTSGADGIHVLVPIARRHTYADTREFSAIIAGALARTHRGLVDDRVDEGEAPRRAHRLEPERRGEDDRVGLLGAAEGGRAGLDAAALGRGERGARPGGVHDGGRARPRSRSTATSSRAC